jgi:HEPN domain-containing protein
MKPLTAEWVVKAEADYDGAVALRRMRKRPLHDLVCFHCQQCAEKYLKALLQEAGVSFPKTHVLIDLLNLLTPMDPGLARFRSHLLVLEDYAVKFRYPGLYASAVQSRGALTALRATRRGLRKKLGI